MPESARRIGRFEIDPAIWERAPDAILQMLSGCFPVRVEMMHYSGRLEYVAYGEHFDPVPNGEMVPWYMCDVTDLRGGKYHVEWKRR